MLCVADTVIIIICVTCAKGFLDSNYNPNTFGGLVGKVRKRLSPEGGRNGGWRKKSMHNVPAGARA